MMRRSTLVGIIVVTMLFQTMLFSTATVNQPISEIQTYDVGDSPDSRVSVVQGDNYFNSTSHINGAIYASFDDFNTTDFFKISVIVLSQNTWVDGSVNNGYAYTSFHNDSRYPQDGRTAHILALNDSIEINVYFDANNYVEFILRITKTDTPKGLTKDDAFEMVIGQPVNISLFYNLGIYTTFTAEKDTWYAIDVETEFNDTYLSIDFMDLNNQYFDYSSGRVPGTLYNKFDISGKIFGLLTTWDREQNITLTLEEREPPLGYSSENPITLVLGETNDYSIPGSNTYFQAHVVETQSYLFSFEFSDTKVDHFYVQFINQNPYGGYYSGSNYDSNKGDIFYYSEQTEDILLVLYAYDLDTNASVNANFKEVDTPSHVTMEDAEVIELGDSQAQTIYGGQAYWMKFNAEKDVFYQVNVNSYNWPRVQIFDENGIRYNRNDAFISTSGTVYFKISQNIASSFTLHIEKGILPSDLTTTYYSSNFQAGDYFEYSLNYTQIGQQIDDLPPDSTFRVDVLHDAPSMNEYQVSGIKISLNGYDQPGIGLEPFLLPTAIDTPDQTIEGIDIIINMFGSINITEENGQYILRESYNNTEYNQTSFTELVYDAVDHYLISYRIYEKYDDSELDLTLVLTDFKVSGPRPTETSGDAPLTVPFQPSFVLVGLILLPIIRKRRKQTDTSI